MAKVKSAKDQRLPAARTVEGAKARVQGLGFNVDLHFINPPLNYKTPPPELNSLPAKKLGVVLCCLFCSTERETAATTTASAVQKERNSSYYHRFRFAERQKLQLLRPLQLCRERERNCSYYDRFSCAEREREKLQLLRPLQLCRERVTAATTAVLRLYYCDTVLLYYNDRPPLNSQSPLPRACNQSRGGLLIGGQH